MARELTAEPKAEYERALDDAWGVFGPILRLYHRPSLSARMIDEARGDTAYRYTLASFKAAVLKYAHFTSPALPTEVCMRCDGCGWYEGGKTLQTKCRECGGTGEVPFSVRGVTQTITGDDGNCLEAALATVLGLTLEDVPRFRDETWWGQLLDFLALRGLSCQSTMDPPSGLSIAVGESPRRSVKHAVVAINGVLAFDPHPDRTFFKPASDVSFLAITPAHPAPRDPHPDIPSRAARPISHAGEAK